MQTYAEYVPDDYQHVYDVSDENAPGLYFPLSHFKGPLKGIEALKAYIAANCTSEEVSGTLLWDLVGFVDIQELTTEPDYVIFYDDYYSEVGPAGGLGDYSSATAPGAAPAGSAPESSKPAPASAGQEAPPLPPPSDPAVDLPAVITVCRDNKGILEETFACAPEVACLCGTCAVVPVVHHALLQCSP